MTSLLLIVSPLYQVASTGGPFPAVLVVAAAWLVVRRQWGW